MIGEKLLRVLRLCFHPKRPEFIFSLSYFRLRPDPYIVLHRQLFFLSCNSPGRLLNQVLLWCCWISYGVWKRSFLVSKAATPEQLACYGLSRGRLLKELLQFGLVYSLAPYQYLRSQLYKKDSQAQVFHYVYDHQAAYFHHYTNRHFLDYKSSVQLIGDKYKLHQALNQHNIPTVPSRFYKTAELISNPALLFQKRSIFCKPNEASSSEDAFSLNYDEKKEAYQVEPIHHEPLMEHKNINRYLKRVFSRHIYFLLQPVMEDHQELKEFNVEKAVTTLRIITYKATCITNPVVIFLQLEIPKQKKKVGKKQKQFYTILPLHWESLEIDPYFQKKYSHLHLTTFSISTLLKKQIRLAQKYCIEAHQRLLNLCSVAFDVILSPEGPVILEANFNWSVELLYQVLCFDRLQSERSHPAVIWHRQMFYKEQRGVDEGK